jgi:hypothetical protein
VAKHLVFDLEIARPIPMKGKTPDWSKVVDCGVSVCGTWLTNAIAPSIYILDNTRFPDGHDAEALRRAFSEADTLVSWNGVGFDMGVLDGVLPGIMYESAAKRHVDLMVIVAGIYGGMNPDEFMGGVPADWKDRWSINFRGFKLDDIARSTLRMGKTGEGAKAPIDWQNGLYGSVINYCMQDVALTRVLWHHAYNRGYVMKDDERVEIPQKILV